MADGDALKNELFEQLAWTPSKILTTFDALPTSCYAIQEMTTISSTIDDASRTAFSCFSIFPPEILLILLGNLDLYSAIRFRQTCRQANAAVDNLLALSFMSLAPRSLPLLARFGMHREFNTDDLCKRLKEYDCFHCGQMGPFLSLVTQQRCCYRCLRTVPALWAVQSGALEASNNSTSHSALVSSASHQPLHPRFPMINRRSSILLTNFENALAISILPPPWWFGSGRWPEWCQDGWSTELELQEKFTREERKDSISGWCGPPSHVDKAADHVCLESEHRSLPYDNSLKICRIAAIPLPAVREGRAVYGLYCRGCDLTYLNRLEKDSHSSNNGSPSPEWPALAAYREGEFLKHLKDCDGAHELVWGLDKKLATLSSMPSDTLGRDTNVEGGLTGWFMKPSNWARLSREERCAFMMQEHLTKLEAMDLPEAKSGA